MHETSIPNPALGPFGVLIGRWSTVGTHPFRPGATLRGRTTFEWLEGGAFVLMHSEIDEPGFPAGVAVIGSDDSAGTCFMLYFDERKVSRKYDVSLRGGVLRWWRDDPALSQRFTGTIAPDGDVIVGEGEMSREGAPWEGDLALTYTRIP